MVNIPSYIKVGSWKKNPEQIEKMLNYKIIEEDGNGKVYSVIPGKFTLSFSLAIDLYRKLFNKFPKKKSKIIRTKSKHIKRISISKHNLLWN